MTNLLPLALVLAAGFLLLVSGVLLVQTRHHRRQWRLLSRGCPDVLWFWDGRKQRLRASERIWDWVDKTPGGIDDLFLHREQYIAAEDLQRIRQVGKQMQEGTVTLLDLEFRIRFPGRQERWFRAQGILTRHRRWSQVAGSLSDVTELRRLGDRLWRWSHLDELTGLHNRTHLLDRLQYQKSPCTLLLVDIDHFSAVNEAYRHAGGDTVLVWFADALRTLFRGEDLVARSGGDEFVVVVDGDLTLAQRLADRVHEHLKESPGAVPVPWVLTASIGLVPWSPGPAEDLLTKAEQALHRSQAEGGGRSILFDSSIAAEADRRARLEIDLPRAVRKGELRLVFQPQYRLADRRLTGFEALARWTHDDLGEITPTEFIPLAETLGLIPELGAWALGSACNFVAAQPRAQVEGLTVSVNVSALQLREPGFFALVEKIVRDAGVSPSCIELELTETVLVHSSEEVFGRLAALRDRGFRVALDDFGKGYSSLSYLRLMPLDTLKIDRDFLDPAQDPLLGGIVNLGRLLNLQVIAEGVEEDAQLDLLKNHGCDKVQGFLLSRPLDRVAAEALIGRSTPPR